MLSLLLVPVLLGLSMLAQRPVARWLKVRGPVWPLLPFAPDVSGAHRLAVRGSGALFTFALVLGVLFAQARREQHLTTRVEVGPGMAADRAGVQNGDVITAIDGVRVADFAEVRDALLHGAATKQLTLMRGEHELQLSVTLRDGLLGVKSSGEPRETTSLEALRVALRRFLVTPWLLLHAVLGDSPVALSVSSPMGPSAWVAGVTVTLTLSYWLMLAVEWAALALGAVLSRRKS